MSKVFPYNYLLTMLSPFKMFKHRDYLKTWQKILIILLMLSLLMFPISLQLSRMNQVRLADYFPKTVEFIDQEIVDQLHEYQGQGILLDISEPEILKESDELFIAAGPAKEEFQSLFAEKDGLVFLEDSYLIQEKGSQTIKQAYTGDQSLANLETKEELVNVMSQQWFWSNRTALILTNYIYIWILMLVSIVIFVLGASFLLSLMKHNNNYDISGFNEASTIVINSLGIPTIIAFILGMMTGNTIHILSAHSLSFILILIWVYWKTHFNDLYVANQLNKKNKLLEEE